MVDSVAMFDELVVHGEVMGFVLAAYEGIFGDFISFLCFFLSHVQADLHLVLGCSQNFFCFFCCFVC